MRAFSESLSLSQWKSPFDVPEWAPKGLYSANGGPNRELTYDLGIKSPYGLSGQADKR
jgi:hypothetical protein